jgi:hypothetical protein
VARASKASIAGRRRRHTGWRGSNLCHRHVSRQHGRDDGARAGQRHRCRGDELAALTQLLLGANAIESRALALALARSHDRHQSLHLAHLHPRDLEPRPLRTHARHGCCGIGPQLPQAQIPLGLRRGCCCHTGARKGRARSEERQRLLDLEELGKAGGFARVGDEGVWQRHARELLATHHFRFGADGARLRPITHNHLDDFALAAVLGGSEGRTQQTDGGDPGTDLATGRHTTVLG